MERSVAEWVTPHVTGAAQIDPYIVDAWLDLDTVRLGDDQADMVRRVCTQGLGVEVVVGRAGTGKTYSLNTVRRLLTDPNFGGYTLVGVAPTGKAARELEEGAGIESHTVPRFLRDASDSLGADTVVVVDEAGMCGTVDLYRLLSVCRTANAKVILVGDHHQLPEVTAGGGFAEAVVRADGYQAELTVNRRQTQIWEHDALDQLRDGDITKAWDAYVEHDKVVIIDNAADLHARVIDDWWDSHRAGHRALLLAGTRSEARQLNTAARQVAVNAGHVHGHTLEIRDRVFGLGDRVLLTKNMPGQHDLDTGRRCRVDNGMLATISVIHDDQSVTVTLDNQRHIHLAADYVQAGYLDHGYAMTVHKAQGVTCDFVHVVGPSGLYREAWYTAMSRARHGAMLYATSSQVAALDDPHTTGIPLPSERADQPEQRLIDTLERSQAKTFAIRHHHLIDTIADLAAATDLATLEARHLQIRTVINTAVDEGHADPAVVTEVWETADATRQFLHEGGRVRALDGWDNVGVVSAIIDSTAQAAVTFTSTDGRMTTKRLHWWELKPLDNPQPAELTELAATILDDLREPIATATAAWNTRLAAYGVGPDEDHIYRQAITMRIAHNRDGLAGQPPIWLRTWLGDRPADPAGTQIYDDELAALAQWRDRHQLAENVAGYGPKPGDEAHIDDWNRHMDRSLAARHWLNHHTPNLPPPALPTLTPAEIETRIDELDELFAGAPPDQTLIIADLLDSDRSPHEIIDALKDAYSTQAGRRDWILEHWPHVIEHHELQHLRDQLDPLAWWPQPLTEHAQTLLTNIEATTSDTPEHRTLHTIDRELDATDPNRIRSTLADQRSELEHQLEQIKTTTALDHTSRQAHIERLHHRIRDIAAEYDGLRTAATLANWGTRLDPELTTARINRINHLTHTAIVDHETWIAEATRNWATNNPHGTARDLHRHLHTTAEYRELTGWASPDPYGPPLPAEHPHHELWAELQDDLTPPTTPTFELDLT